LQELINKNKKLMNSRKCFFMSKFRRNGSKLK
jgi:hypothetical protein